MKKNKKVVKKGRIGSSFDEFLKDDGIYEEVTARAIKRGISAARTVMVRLIVGETFLRSKDVRDQMPLRQASLDYLASVAQAAEQVGFTAALTPTGLWCEDAWLTTAMLVGRTERLKFLVAFRPGFISPTLAAQQAATFQRHSQGRLLLNVVTGGEAREQRAYGDFLDKDARYRRTAEFLHVVRALWRGETVDHDGVHIRVEGAFLDRLPQPVPSVYFGGSSPAAGEE